MRFPSLAIFRAKPALSHADVAHGLRMWNAEGIVASGFGSLVSGALLAAFALALGANSLQIGILASLPMITQVVQVPGVILVECAEKRKAIAILSQLPGQLLWVPVALIPFLIHTPSGAAVSLLLGLMGLRGLLSAFTNSAWQAWIKDLIPRELLGRSIARRTALTTVTAAIVGLIAGVLIQRLQGTLAPENSILGFSAVILLGVVGLGLWSPFFMSRMPETPMAAPVGSRPSPVRSLLSPLGDRNYRQLLLFLGLWGFALNLAVPFFAVYLLTQLHISLAVVIALSVLSQLSSVMSLEMWGRLVDRFGAKATLSVSASLYLLVIAGWAFTAMPAKAAVLFPLLATLHFFGGIASGGVSVCSGAIGLKLAPEGQAPAYLGAGSLAGNLGGGLGPLIGGLLAQFFTARSFIVQLAFKDSQQTTSYYPFSLTGFDFLFVIAFAVGLFSLSLLASLREEGEVGKEALLNELFAHAPGRLRGLGSMPGHGVFAHFPLGYARHVPGLEVALGVTAYQVASATQKAATVAQRERRTAGVVTERVAAAMRDMAPASDDHRDGGRDLARHATRGVMRAATGAREDTSYLVSEGIRGVIAGLDRAQANMRAIVWGASFGAVEGTQEMGRDVAAAAVQAVRTASSAGMQSGLSEQAATKQAARGALDAAAAIAPETARRVRESLEARIPEVRSLLPAPSLGNTGQATDPRIGPPQPEAGDG